MLRRSTGQIHKDRLVDQLSTMEQRPHENVVVAAKGHMQYRWRRSKLKEQEVVKKEQRKITARIAMKDGKEFDALVGQAVESGDNNFQPNKMARNVHKSKDEDTHIDPKLKANMDLIKATKNVQRAIVQ